MGVSPAVSPGRILHRTSEEASKQLDAGSIPRLVGRVQADGPACRTGFNDVSEALDRLAEAYGISLGYLTEAGTYQRVSERAKRGILAALGVVDRGRADATAGIAAPRARVRRDDAACRHAHCFVPALAEGRAGMGRHLPALRSAVGAELGHRRFRGPGAACGVRRRLRAPISSASIRCTPCFLPIRPGAAPIRPRAAAS